MDLNMTLVNIQAGAVPIQGAQALGRRGLRVYWARDFRDGEVWS